MVSTSYNALHGKNHKNSRGDHDHVDIDYLISDEEYLVLMERLEEYFKDLLSIEYKNCEDPDSFIHFAEFDSERVCLIKLREDPTKYIKVYLEEAENKYGTTTRYRVWADVENESYSEKHLEFTDKYEQADVFEILFKGSDNEEYSRVIRLVKC